MFGFDPPPAFTIRSGGALSDVYRLQREEIERRGRSSAGSLDPATRSLEALGAFHDSVLREKDELYEDWQDHVLAKVAGMRGDAAARSASQAQLMHRVRNTHPMLLQQQRGTSVQLVQRDRLAQVAASKVAGTASSGSSRRNTDPRHVQQWGIGSVDQGAEWGRARRASLSRASERGAAASLSGRRSPTAVAAAEHVPPWAVTEPPSSPPEPVNFRSMGTERVSGAEMRATPKGFADMIASCHEQGGRLSAVSIPSAVHHTPQQLEAMRQLAAEPTEPFSMLPAEQYHTLVAYRAQLEQAAHERESTTAEMLALADVLNSPHSAAPSTPGIAAAAAAAAAASASAASRGGGSAGTAGGGGFGSIGGSSPRLGSPMLPEAPPGKPLIARPEWGRLSHSISVLELKRHLQQKQRDGGSTSPSPSSTYSSPKSKSAAALPRRRASPSPSSPHATTTAATTTAAAAAAAATATASPGGVGRPMPTAAAHRRSAAAARERDVHVPGRLLGGSTSGGTRSAAVAAMAHQPPQAPAFVPELLMQSILKDLELPPSAAAALPASSRPLRAEPGGAGGASFGGSCGSGGFGTAPRATAASRRAQQRSHSDAASALSSTNVLSTSSLTPGGGSRQQPPATAHAKVAAAAAAPTAAAVASAAIAAAAAPEAAAGGGATDGGAADGGKSPPSPLRSPQRSPRMVLPTAPRVDVARIAEARAESRVRGEGSSEARATARAEPWAHPGGAGLGGSGGGCGGGGGGGGGSALPGGAPDIDPSGISGSSLSLLSKGSSTAATPAAAAAAASTTTAPPALASAAAAPAAGAAPTTAAPAAAAKPTTVELPIPSCLGTPLDTTAGAGASAATAGD